MGSVDEGDDAFAAERGEFRAEFALVAAVERCRAGRQVGERPPGENGSGPRPGGDGEADPLGQLAEVVGRADIAEHAAARDVVARVAGLAQAADDRVGVDIDNHARKEEQTADPDVGLCEPVVVIVRGRDEEDPSALHQRIERIERHAHRHDAGGHCGAAPDEQREDEGPLQVVALEQEKK